MPIETRLYMKGYEFFCFKTLQLTMVMQDIICRTDHAVGESNNKNY